MVETATLNAASVPVNTDSENFTTTATTTITEDEVTFAKVLTNLKKTKTPIKESSRPKEKGVTITESSIKIKTKLITAAQSHDKGKSILIEELVVKPSMKDKQQ